MIKDADIQRVFLGISPNGWGSLLLEVQQRLQKTLALNSSDIAWSKKASLHATLLFLGNLPTPKIKTLHEMLKQCTFSDNAYLKALTLALLGQSNVVLLLEEQGLIALYHQLYEKAKTLGLDLDTRPFRPHITLGKLKNRMLKDTVRAKLAVESTASFSMIQVLSMNLYRSFPQQHYEVIKQYHL